MKKLFIIALILFSALQFMPRPKVNSQELIQSTEISVVHKTSTEVKHILEKSCYDCHSNHTEYPWYYNIQPLSMWIGHHIEEGKEELNFSEFGDYSIRRQFHKLEEIAEQVDENEMPLNSYTLIHSSAKLSHHQKELIVNWVHGLRDSFRISYPTDSLQRKKSH